MIDAGVGQHSSTEEMKIRQAADQACKELEGELIPEARPAAKLLAALRARVREAPLPALAIAFILGVMASRR
jgi:hypothetical protein